MPEIVINTPLVSVAWLNQHLGTKNLVVLDATIPKVTLTDSALDEVEMQIPSARFFDLKKKFSDQAAPFPNTFPSAEQFELEAQNIGINSNSAIVVYDQKGLYSSARAWWLFKVFGHKNVAVLNGGFPAWKMAGFNTEKTAAYTGTKGNFKAQLQPGMMKFLMI